MRDGPETMTGERSGSQTAEVAGEGAEEAAEDGECAVAELTAEIEMRRELITSSEK